MACLACSGAVNLTNIYGHDFTNFEIHARASSAHPLSNPRPAGTHSADRCTANTSRANSTDTQRTCRTKRVVLPGRTKACVTRRASPFPITPLHPLHRARDVGAASSENVLR